MENAFKNLPDVAAILSAVHFAAGKHCDQRRKDPAASPYINHPVEVAQTLAELGGVRDIAMLTAALLHDTIEDTETTADELVAAFGAEVSELVAEVSDDKSLQKQARKQAQIDHAAGLSDAARQIKLADKICNVRDVIWHAPPDWSQQRRIEYLEWAEKVVAGCRGVNPALEARFDELLLSGLKELKSGGS